MMNLERSAAGAHGGRVYLILLFVQCISVKVFTEIQLTFCCGSSVCAKVSLHFTTLLSKFDVNVLLCVRHTITFCSLLYTCLMKQKE